MQNKSRASSTFKTLATLLLALLVGLASAQSRTDARVVEQEGQRGIVELYEAITPLQSVASFMTIGAHPDDERSSQIALLSRGLGVRSITVTANRGEGGQNSIGTEYQQALGVLRSREMEQSSAAFNVELFFLSESFDDPILDFRFSKSAVETLEIWGEDVMMEKLVRAIRESRPDILFTNFQNVFGQHGNHRAMAYATEQAFALAGDPTARSTSRPASSRGSRQVLPPRRPRRRSGRRGAADDPAARHRRLQPVLRRYLRAARSAVARLPPQPGHGQLA